LYDDGKVNNNNNNNNNSIYIRSIEIRGPIFEKSYDEFTIVKSS